MSISFPGANPAYLLPKPSAPDFSEMNPSRISSDSERTPNSPPPPYSNRKMVLYPDQKPVIPTPPNSKRIITRETQPTKTDWSKRLFTLGGATAIAAGGIGIKLGIAAAMTAPLFPVSLALGCLAIIFLIGALIAKYRASNESVQNRSQSLSQQSYMDFGLSFGCSIWSFINWNSNPPVLNTAQLNVYLQSLFQQMKASGLNTLNIAFSQLSNIDSFAANDFTGPLDNSDVVKVLLQQLAQSNLQIEGYGNFLEFFCAQAKANGMKIAISDGGEAAQDPTMKILNSPTETFAGQATKLAGFMKQYGIDQIDFDIESPTWLSSQGTDPTGAGAVNFFKTLHSELSQAGKTMTLTSMLGLNWPTVALKPLFYDDQGNQIFSTLFDGLNLMAYSDTQYYIDANNTSWGIEQWLDIVGKENAHLIHLGFDDGVPYEQPGASAGETYNIKPGSTRGQAAAQIYQIMSAQLTVDGYTTPLGDPFWWPGVNVQPNGYSRYAPADGTGKIVSNFVSSAMQDFYNSL